MSVAAAPLLLIFNPPTPPLPIELAYVMLLPLRSIVAPPTVNVTRWPEMSVLVELVAYLRVPPLNVSAALAEPIELPLPITSVPASSTVGPVYVLGPTNVTLLLPASVTAVEPVMPCAPASLLVIV